MCERKIWGFPHSQASWLCRVWQGLPAQLVGFSTCRGDCFNSSKSCGKPVRRRHQGWIGDVVLKSRPQMSSCSTAITHLPAFSPRSSITPAVSSVGTELTGLPRGTVEGIGVHAMVQFPTLPLTPCVTLGKSPASLCLTSPAIAQPLSVLSI